MSDYLNDEIVGSVSDDLNNGYVNWVTQLIELWKQIILKLLYQILFVNTILETLTILLRIVCFSKKNF